MSLILLPASARKRAGDGPLVKWIKRTYRFLLGGALRFRWTTLTATGLLFATIAMSIPWLGEELMPKFRDTDFLMHWVEKPGIGIDAMDRITIRASEELMSVPGVRNFGSHIGRATVADEVVGPNFTELWISIDDNNYEETVARVQSFVVRGDEQLRSDLSSLGDLMIDTPSGSQVPLTSVATVSIVPAPNEIKREGASRRLDITCNVSGRDLASVLPLILKKRCVPKLLSSKAIIPSFSENMRKPSPPASDSCCSPWDPC